MAQSALPWKHRWRAYMAMLLFGLPSIVSALLGGAFWPFLDYRMYAESKLTPEIDWLALYGRTETGTLIPLNDERYIVPFGPSEVLRALDTLGISGDADPTPARRALAGLLSAYETRRRAGKHEGPPLIALEVYQVHIAAPYHAPDTVTYTILQSVTLATTP